MKSLALIKVFLISTVLFALSCEEPPPAKNPDVTVPLVLGPPVETQAANTNYKPAFIGQTRIGSLTTKIPYEHKIITTSLKNPWGIVGLPNGKLLVTEQSGTMRILTTEGLIGSPIANIPAVNPSGQGGLLGLCIDPNFITNRMVYWAFSENVAGGSITSVAKGKLSENDAIMESVAVIYRSNTPFNGNLHFGARIVIDNTGHLLVCIGERSSTSTRQLAQSVSSSLGKVIRITTDGAKAFDNPKYSGAGALGELYTIGHRNPQGLAIHPITGDVWLGEFGPKGGDEINLLKPGKNYGWPLITYGIEYSGQKVGDGIQQKEDMEQPIYYWDPAVSPSGMTFYKGNRVPEWQNNLFVGALGGTHLLRLHITNNVVQGEERLLSGENQRFRDITQGSDGALYAVTDAGRLYKIDKK
ncbi:MAG: PQQ-dependent sugar dehydrogenase [Bacteroidetes bacterium]|nr:PQQ-dependent sugar dehydrogenase [Bacteroidota bacterium]